MAGCEDVNDAERLSQGPKSRLIGSERDPAGNRSQLAQNGGDALGHAGMCKRDSVPLQTKLTVNATGDMYEKEADGVANKVTQNSDGQTLVARVSRVFRPTA